MLQSGDGHLPTSLLESECMESGGDRGLRTGIIYFKNHCPPFIRRISTMDGVEPSAFTDYQDLPISCIRIHT
jgi:hypothetical protein